MVVTRTDVSQLRQRSRRRRMRDLEAVALVVVSVLWILALVRTYGAVAEPFAELELRQQQGEIVDLNSIARPEALVPLLDLLPPGERSWVADKVWQYLNRTGGDPLSNVGELSRIRITAEEIDAKPELRSFSRRLEQLVAGRDPGAGSPTLTLLTPAQLGELKPRVIVRTPSAFASSVRRHAGLILLGFLVVHVTWRIRGFFGDSWILPLILALVGVGFLGMLSIRDPLRDLTIFKGFAQGIASGTLLLLAASQLDYGHRFWRRASFLFLALGALLSVFLILFGTGPGNSDAKVNLLGAQPVEAIKILFVFFLAGYFSDRWEFLRELPEKHRRITRFLRLPRLEYVAPVVVSMLVVLTFFFLQRDLGPALVLSLLFLLLYYVARGKAGLAILGFAILGAGFYAGYRLGVPRTVASRVTMWLSPWENDYAGGDHLAKTLWSLASGGFSGTGLGRGDPEFVPAVHTDMILAAVGEETGFVGLLLVFLLFGLLISRLLRAAFGIRDPHGFFLALGLTLALAIQMMLISGGALGLLPLSGIATPFLSFGRSSMLANFLMAGILMSISHRGGGNRSLRPLHRPARRVALVLVAALVVMVARAATVQVVEADRLLIQGSLARQADGVRRYQYNPRLVRIARQILRGAIVDRNGLPLATSEWADLEQHWPAYEKLGVPLGSKPKANVSRFYPFDGFTFHLLGDLRNRRNWAAANTSFAERDSRTRLQGFDDQTRVVSVRSPDGGTTRLVERDYGELIPLLRHRQNPEHPEVRQFLERDRTLRMTLDMRFQVRVADILGQHVGLAGAERGAAVFLDVANGDLLASVSYPWPTSPAEDDGAGLIDRARYGVYPPGSSFKLVSAIAALRRDPDLAERTFECVQLADGRVGNEVRGWGKPIRDDPQTRTPHGTVNLRRGISRSCNAYFAQLVTYEVGASALLETAELFDIAVARPNSPEILQDALPQAAFGQGQVTTTPFEMARVAATLAAGGLMPQGRWVADESNARHQAPRRIFPAGEARFIAEAMRQAVTEGTARSLGDVLPAIAGKTGTAEVEGRRSHGWFVGFTPYGEGDGRVVAFCVLIENGGYGGRYPAQAAGEMVRQAAILGLIGPAAEGGAEP